MHDEDGERIARARRGSEESTLDMKAKTPLIDEQVLEGFDMQKDEIKSIIMNPDLEQVLEQESKPVRDVLKANYGVVFNEEVQRGGKQNCRIAGMTYYEKPGRNMKREELKSR